MAQPELRSPNVSRSGLHALGRNRQPQRKHRAAFLPVATGNLAAVLLNNPVARTKTQSGATADGLGCVKGIKDSLRLANPNAAIDEVQDKLPHIPSQPEIQGTAPFLLQGLNCILGDVGEDLEKPVSVAPDSGRLGSRSVSIRMFLSSATMA